MLQDTVQMLQVSQLGILVHASLHCGAFWEVLDAFPQNFDMA